MDLFSNEISSYLFCLQRREFMKAFAQTHMENTALGIRSFPLLKPSHSLKFNDGAEEMEM